MHWCSHIAYILIGKNPSPPCTQTYPFCWTSLPFCVYILCEWPQGSIKTHCTLELKSGTCHLLDYFPRSLIIICVILLCITWNVISKVYLASKNFAIWNYSGLPLLPQIRMFFSISLCSLQILLQYGDLHRWHTMPTGGLLLLVS